MQQKNFYASFIQARAYDRRYRKLGEKIMEVARVATDNDDYQTAIAAYAYVKKEYQTGPFYLQAQVGLIRAQEARVKNSYPVAKDSVISLIKGYDHFIAQYPDNSNALEAQRSEAMLYATYLDEKDKAIAILTKLISNPRANMQLKAKAKLDLGDIYLLKGEPWESTLLFSQVEKTLEENPVGYEAKLKNAKLCFYKGDFRLAQEHLDILKEATTREIANDAMDLSMLIKENIALDSAGDALKAYASIELKLYQHKTDQALAEIKSLKEGKTKISTASAIERGIQTTEVLKAITNKQDSVEVPISNHRILDDVYWLEANLRMERGEFDNAIKLLQQILDEYGNDVLADDAYFQQAEIYDRHLKDKTKAMDAYREFLNRFPGSVYAAEARKRFRMLRGDFTDHPEQVVPQFNN
jgi:outer membrane protein assembly factor BamD (BamD/ComL family)